MVMKYYKTCLLFDLKPIEMSDYGDDFDDYD